jgi:hypothetical protein
MRSCMQLARGTALPGTVASGMCSQTSPAAAETRTGGSLMAGKITLKKFSDHALRVTLVADIEIGAEPGWPACCGGAGTARATGARAAGASAGGRPGA